MSWQISRQIREQDPLKQGLKLIENNDVHDTWGPIREQDPLKQGLKLDPTAPKNIRALPFVSKIH